MSPLVLTLITTIFISLLSLSGAIFLFIFKKKLQNYLLHIVALAAGTLMGSAFLHLIPESANTIGIDNVSKLVLIAFVGFFILERILRWHHHHEYEAEQHTLGYISLTGDLLHNFLDGLIIYASFYLDPALGLTTALAVMLHEIPQEIGDFGVLLHSGFSTSKAVLANLFVSLTSVLGGIVGFIWLEGSTTLTPYITAFAAGGFIYTAASDLLPELKNESKNKSWATFLIFILGVLIMSFSK